MDAKGLRECLGWLAWQITSNRAVGYDGADPIDLDLSKADELYEAFRAGLGLIDQQQARIAELEEAFQTLIVKWRLYSDPYHGMCVADLEAALEASRE